jgi:hypothetical protein
MNTKNLDEVQFKLKLSNQIIKEFNKILKRVRATKKKMDYVFTVNDIISICNKRVAFEKYKKSYLQKEEAEIKKSKVDDNKFKELFEQSYVYKTGVLYEQNKR